MKAAAFSYVKVHSVDEAVKQLASMPGEAKAIAGGQSLGPMLNLRLARPKHLVDVSRIDALKTVADEGAAWRIGASVTHSQLEDKPLKGLEPISRVARIIAYRAVRTRGTIGGSLAHADPAADWPVVLPCLDATIRLVGPSGKREVKAESFMTSAFATVLRDDELIESVSIPKLSAGAAWGYYKFCRKTGEFPEAAAAVLLDPERRVARVFAGALDKPPQPLPTVARTLAQGGAQAVTPDMIDAEMQRVAPGLGPVGRKLRVTAVKRAIQQAFPA